MLKYNPYLMINNVFLIWRRAQRLTTCSGFSCYGSYFYSISNLINILIKITHLILKHALLTYLFSCFDLVSLRKSVQQQTLSSQFASKIMQTGRVVVIDNESYHCHAAVVLKVKHVCLCSHGVHSP